MPRSLRSYGSTGENSHIVMAIFWNGWRGVFRRVWVRPRKWCKIQKNSNPQNLLILNQSNLFFSLLPSGSPLSSRISPTGSNQKAKSVEKFTGAPSFMCDFFPAASPMFPRCFKDVSRGDTIHDPVYPGFPLPALLMWRVFLVSVVWAVRYPMGTSAPTRITEPLLNPTVCSFRPIATDDHPWRL